MAGSIEVVPIADRNLDGEIDTFLDQCPTSFAQQTPSWRDVIANTGTDEAAWLGCWQGGVLAGLLPAFRFEGPLGAILTSVPQAGPLGGIACAEPADREAVFQALTAAFLDRARALDCDLATVISNPFWPDRDLYERFLAPDYVLENALLALDLTVDFDDAGTPLRGTTALRRNLRRARSGALQIDEDQSVANVETWYDIHARRHREIGATPLPRDLILGALEHMVPKGRARFFFVRAVETGEMASGGLYLRHALVVDAFMPSMDSRYADLRPNHLLGAHSIAWAREQGCRFYNWQGSPPGGGVDRFKRQWGSREHGYAFLTRVTGDASRFLRASVAEVSEAYRWHYVLPFDLLGVERVDGGTSSRERAWSSLSEQR
jgi:hypothetical protein